MTYASCGQNAWTTEIEGEWLSPEEDTAAINITRSDVRPHYPVEANR